MRKLITLLMTLLVTGSVSSANATGQLDFEAGYSHYDISWKQRVPSNDPHFTSDLRFKDLDVFQIGVNGRTTIGYNLYLRANAYWGWILDGEYRRKIERSFNDYYNSDLRFGFEGKNRGVIDDNWVYGLGIAVGYPFYFCECSAVVAPVIGYSVDSQSIRADDRSFHFNNNEGYDDAPCATRGGCCRQSFNSRWYGPFVGVDFSYRPFNDCWDFYADIEYHWGDFKGRQGNLDENDSNHNRRSHKARGWVFAVGAEYDIDDCWSFGLSFKAQDWHANRHHKQRDCSGESALNSKGHNKLHAYTINLTLSRGF